jgi:antitoxin PrlF
MREGITRITSKGQVTVPVAIRRALGLKPKDRLEFRLEDGVATIRKAESIVNKLAGSVKYEGPPLDFKKLRKDFEADMGRQAARGSGLEHLLDEE